MTFEITVNGAVERLPTRPATVGDLVRALNLTGKRIAIERNGEIVPRSRFPEARLADGDRIEVVVAVGGG